MRACPDCGADISERMWTARRCVRCAALHARKLKRESDSRSYRRKLAAEGRAPLIHLPPLPVAAVLRQRRAEGTSVPQLARRYAARFGGSIAAAERSCYRILNGEGNVPLCRADEWLLCNGFTLDELYPEAVAS